MKNPAKSILYPEGFKGWRNQRLVSDFDAAAHAMVHRPSSWGWSSPDPIDTNAGRRWYPDEGGRLVSVFLSVDSAPSSTLTWALLKNGTSVFTTNPTILAGAFYGTFQQYIPNPEFQFGDYFQFQITATGSSTGRAVGVVRYLPVGF